MWCCHGNIDQNIRFFGRRTTKAWSTQYLEDVLNKESSILRRTSVLPQLWERGHCSAGSTGQLLLRGLDEWSWCSAGRPCTDKRHTMTTLLSVTSFDRVCLSVTTVSYLRAVSPLVPSSGHGGSLDRAWQRKRRGTAHQCLEPSCWISWSKT